MRDMAGKISELKFEAPLARFEEEDTASLKNMNLLTGARDASRPLSHFPFARPCRFVADPRNLGRRDRKFIAMPSNRDETRLRARCVKCQNYAKPSVVLIFPVSRLWSISNRSECGWSCWRSNVKRFDGGQLARRIGFPKNSVPPPGLSISGNFETERAGKREQVSWLRERVKCAVHSWSRSFYRRAN